MSASAVVSLKSADTISSSSFVMKLLHFTEWLKWEKGSEAIPVHCLAWPWCPRTPNTVLGFPAASQDLQPTWCWTYGCALQVSPEGSSKHCMSRLLLSVSLQMKVWFSFKQTSESVKEKDGCVANQGPEYGTANLGRLELFYLVCAQLI